MPLAKRHRARQMFSPAYARNLGARPCTDALLLQERGTHSLSETQGPRRRLFQRMRDLNRRFQTRAPRKGTGAGGARSCSAPLSADAA